MIVDIVVATAVVATITKANARDRPRALIVLQPPPSAAVLEVRHTKNPGVITASGFLVLAPLPNRPHNHAN